ncbi:protein ENTREP3 [Erpetoichthys calabaricus]|nr:protein ENTREP3 [Erpetoichthys calabaricus]
MPSPSDSSHSLSPGTSRSLSRLGVQRARTQLLLALGIVQMGLGSMIVAVSFVAVAFTSSTKVRHSCPFWAGFFVVISGLVGVMSWRRPLTLVVSLFMLLSAVCVILSLAGSILSCQNAQLVKSLEACQMPNIGKEGVCICCQTFSKPPQTSTCGPIGETLKLYPYKDCRTVRVALKDLLFSACGLSILSTVICTLSTVTCCIHIFSLDLLHILVPHRSRSVNPECSTPQDAFLNNIMDFEEFVPPVPPPPYYPPEYTCSSETDAQSITYNGSMESPVPLYPTDFPPPYEAVMGQRAESQATVFDAPVNELSCERITSTVFSGEVSMDSGSLMMSEIIDIPDDSSPSEDSCLLEVGAGGSLRSVDYVNFRSMNPSLQQHQNQDCSRNTDMLMQPVSSVMQPIRPSPKRDPKRYFRGERSNSCSSPSSSACDSPFRSSLLHYQPASSCTRLDTLGGSSVKSRVNSSSRVPEIRVRPSTPSRRNSEGSLSSQGSSQLQPFPQRRHSDQSRPPTPPRALMPHPLMRSHSDPGLSTSNETGDFSASACSKGLSDEASQISSDTVPCSETYLLPATHLVPPTSILRKNSSKSNKLMLKHIPAAQHRLSKEGTKSLGDLKVTRVLVARFLQRSKKNLATGGDPAGNSSQGHKRRPDFGGNNPFEQVLRASWQVARPSRQEGIHLQSCGDLNSSSSLRRLLSSGRLDQSRPHSLSGMYRESAL